MDEIITYTLDTIDDMYYEFNGNNLDYLDKFTWVRSLNADYGSQMKGTLRFKGKNSSRNELTFIEEINNAKSVAKASNIVVELNSMPTNIVCKKFEVGEYYSIRRSKTPRTSVMIIILLPIHYHTGGELNIIDSKGTVHTIDTNVTKPTFVAFNPNLLYDISEVKSGTMCMFNATLEKPIHITSKMLQMRTLNVSKTKTHTDTYRTKLVHLTDTIRRNVEKITDNTNDHVVIINKTLDKICDISIEDDEYEYDIESIVREIDESGTIMSCIVLRNYYPTIKNDMVFYEEDAKLIGTINSMYRGVYLKNLTYESCNNNDALVCRNTIDNFGKTDGKHYDSCLVDDINHTYINKIFTKDCGTTHNVTKYIGISKCDVSVTNYTCLVVQKV
jgi:hypothetical protein